jgi:hypothetical protein
LANSYSAEGLRVSRAEIEQIRGAAAVIRDCRRELDVRRADLVGEVMASSLPICTWRHYPDGEVYDPKSHAQYFFHAHPPDSLYGSERGHFHTFLRAEGMPSGVTPLLLPELAVADVPALPAQAAPVKRGTRDEVSHLVAIAMDARGEPTRLFTTNRWVTGETWYRAEDVTQMLDCFVVAEPEPSAVLNRWISAMIKLFRPQITALLQVRDDTVMAWRRRRRTHVFEDTRLEVTSTIEIDLDVQLSFVDGISCGSDDVFQGFPSLPPMADGWGHADDPPR